MSRTSAGRSTPAALLLALAFGAVCHLLVRPVPPCARRGAGAAFARGLAAGAAGRRSFPSTRRAALQWLRVEESAPAEQASEGSLTLPVLPMCGVPWPGHQVLLKITDPSHVQMYMDILESGSRRIVVPYCKTRNDGRVRMSEQAEEDQRVHSCGSLLYLTALEDVRERTNGAYKYLATHEVRGRVHINRLLNPAVLFMNDQEAQFETDYLRGEVEILEDQDIGTSNDDGLSKLPSWEGIEEAWTELNEMSEVLEEPRLQGEDAIKDVGCSTWRATAIWELLNRKLRAHRKHAATYGEIRAWIKEQQEAGKLPAELPEQLNACKLGVPPLLVEKLRKAEKDRPELTLEHWHPFLRILATRDAKRRGRLLRQMICMEARTARTHVMLQGLLSQ